MTPRRAAIEAVTLYDVTPGRPLTLTSVAGVIALGALVSAYVPARRAAGIDPMEVLRDR